MTYMPFDGESYVYFGGSFALIGLTKTTSSMAAFYETYKTKPNTTQLLVSNHCITFSSQIIFKGNMHRRTHLEQECFVKDRIECLAMNFGFVFLFLWHQVDFHIRIRRSRHIHSRQVGGLNNADGQLKGAVIKP